MAMVFRAERDLSNPQGDLPPNIGPGSYIGHSYLRAKPAAAPFNSQVTRSKPLKQDSAPGPGSYNVDFVSEGYPSLTHLGKKWFSSLRSPKLKSSKSLASSQSSPPSPGVFKIKLLWKLPGTLPNLFSPGAYESSLSTKPI